MSQFSDIKKEEELEEDVIDKYFKIINSDKSLSTDKELYSQLEKS
jgi:hypothetical protein